MKKSELDRMMEKAIELSRGTDDPQIELMGMLVAICGEQLLQVGEIRRATNDLGPKIDATAQAVADLEEKVSGKLAITNYDFEERPNDER